MKLKKSLPDPLKRREILYGKDTPREVLIHYGDLYYEVGRLNDAVEFYGRANHREALLKLRDLALEEGDFFLFQQATEFLGENTPNEIWRILGQNALKKGKLSFARKAFSQAEDIEALKEIEKMMKKEESGERGK
jgi:tetratricopeptide (TPR) repeat protein